MIREFWLQNDKGQKFNFNTDNKAPITRVQGLGYKDSNSYFEYKFAFKTLEKKMTMANPQGTIWFLDGYAGYDRLLDYLKTSDTIYLYYKCGNEAKYCEVEINEISKAELYSEYGLNVGIVFDRKTLWMRDNIISITMTTVGGNKVYEYTYDYVYAQATEGVVTVVNNGMEEAPLDVEINGSVSNPVIQILDDDDNIISESAWTITDSGGTLKLISEETKEEMTWTKGNQVFNLYQDQDFTKDGFLFLPKGSSKIRVDTGTPASASLSIKLKYVERFRGA